MQLANPENFKQFVQNKDSKTITTSEIVAKVFGKYHKHVIRDIREILEAGDDEFNRTNFGLVEYIDKKGEKRPMFEMTKDGFMLLVMGYKTKKAMAIKIAYIKAFNFMQEQLVQSGMTLLEQYYQVLGEYQSDKRFASLCGAGLSQWKGKKPLLEGTLSVFEDKLQFELPIK
ncbi:MAG: Rha family transcriptional regulator [Haemophilus paraphrohaemolyticus]|uniref:Rha family transcriptional regulator n=1 Tax=Haemophilus paraphrohaemolyticus TaxID=736 RepID=UPI001ED356EF|nr:Rha family transcriptional regulator [Haemophilus paraphrohaemolyticus]MBS6673254.1 Rha family transcriptional regulator [Haemophilus paraphrohaemolyticus]DAY41463.1 MAG TPA: regulatory protein [Caudoviricetes sp.]